MPYLFSRAKTMHKIIKTIKMLFTDVTDLIETPQTYSGMFTFSIYYIDKPFLFFFFNVTDISDIFLYYAPLIHCSSNWDSWLYLPGKIWQCLSARKQPTHQDKLLFFPFNHHLVLTFPSIHELFSYLFCAIPTCCLAQTLVVTFLKYVSDWRSYSGLAWQISLSFPFF